MKLSLGHETVSILNSNYDMENIEAWFEEKSEKDALKNIKGYGKLHVCRAIDTLEDEDKSKKIKELQHIYFGRKSTNISMMREKAFKERQTLLQRQLSDNLSKVVGVLKCHTKILGNVQEKIKNIMDINNLYNAANEVVPDFDEITASKNIDMGQVALVADKELNMLLDSDAMIESLNRMRYIYINMCSNYDFIHKTRSVIDYLILLRNKHIGLATAPKTFNVKQHIKNEVDDIINEMKQI